MKNTALRLYACFIIWGLFIQSLQMYAADPARFAKIIDEWTTKDQTNPPPKGLTLFIGSSSIKKWKSLEQDFPKDTVLNRGFGGSWTADVLHYMDRIVLPYKPSRIVVYCGENDIAHGEAMEVPLENWKIFVERIRKILPKTRFYYIPMKPNPKRWNLWPEYQKGNRLIQDYCEKKDISFLGNIPKRMLGEDENPRPGIFAKDQLHLNADGYKIWVEEVRKAFETDSRKP
jgi:lysophospholipase L1-like esterase